MKGKTALVTGSSHGLGLAMADALAEAGCRVTLHGVEPAAVAEPARAAFEARHGRPTAYVQGDLNEPGVIDDVVMAAAESAGGVDVLVNNAVVRHFAPIESFPMDAWLRALNVNLTAAYRAIQLTLPGMRARGWGRIVNMTSVYGMRGTARRVDYVTTKSALLGLTRAVAVETLGSGITCNAICPGAVHTPASEGRIRALMDDEGIERDAAVKSFLHGKQPTGQFVEAAHVASLVMFLCGAAADQITGAMLPVEGGWLAT